MLISYRALFALSLSLLSACGDTAANHTVTVTVSGPGQVVSEPQGVSCGSSCSLTLPAGTVLRLTGQPAAGAKLQGWGGAPACTAGAADCWFPLGADTSVQATFVAVTAAATCSDGVRDGSETDVDCGGSCGPCGNDRACAQGSDCLAGQCIGGFCTACPLGRNLVSDGDAETQVTGDPLPGWTLANGFTRQTYGAAGGFPSSTDPGPAQRGAYFFYGGPNSDSATARQTIDLSACSHLLDYKSVQLDLSAYLGGFAGQDDNVTLTVGIKQGAFVTQTVTLGPVLDSDRNGQTGMVQRTRSLVVPPGTCGLDLTLTSTRTSGVSNDGYADNVSATLSVP